MKFANHGDVESLYIHWPFCPYRCFYCPFIALSGHDEFMEQYHTILVKEICDFAQTNKILNSNPLKTIYFGGGTPSTYPENLLLDMMSILNSEFNIDKNTEVTLEVNPGTVTLEKLALWKRAGINRLSIGVQSNNNKALKALNRHQVFSDVQWLIDNGSPFFENMSVDIIVGLPGVSDVEWKQLINTIVLWPIKHISLYFLTIHEDTPLYFGVKKSKFILPTDDLTVDLYYWSIDMLARHGFEQYEISSFARKGYQSQHNKAYWLRKPYKGFGLGACSFDGKARLQNEKNLMNYLKGVEQHNNITIFYETLEEKQVWLEELMLGLRQPNGVCCDTLGMRLSDKQRVLFNKSINTLIKSQFLKRIDNCIALTPAGLSVVNEVIVQLCVID